MAMGLSMVIGLQTGPARCFTTYLAVLSYFYVGGRWEETWLPGLGHTLVRPLCGVPVDDPYSYPPLDRRHRWCMLV